MDSSKIVSIVAIAISIVSMGLLVGINSILQSNIQKLENDLHEQLKISKSLDSDLNSTHLLLDTQRAKMEELGSNITMIRESDRSGFLELQNEITNIQANITSMNNNTELLVKKVVSLEEKINASAALVPNQFTFKPITLSDENNKNWTSHYIKEKLYDARFNSWPSPLLKPGHHTGVVKHLRQQIRQAECLGKDRHPAESANLCSVCQHSPECATF